MESLFCFSVDKIFKRQILLLKYFGTKISEDESYNTALTLVVCSTILMIVFCILEAAFYYLYSHKVVCSLDVILQNSLSLVSPMDQNCEWNHLTFT